MQGVEDFENERLKSVKTREPASPSAVMQVRIFRSVYHRFAALNFSINSVA